MLPFWWSGVLVLCGVEVDQCQSCKSHKTQRDRDKIERFCCCWDYSITQRERERGESEQKRKRTGIGGSNDVVVEQAVVENRPGHSKCRRPTTRLRWVRHCTAMAQLKEGKANGKKDNRKNKLTKQGLSFLSKLHSLYTFFLG